MSGNTLRELLNRARWRDENLHAHEVVVVHRGAPGDRRAIEGSRITDVRPNGIALSPDEPEGDAIFVPFHRFLSIVAPDGAVLWEKSKSADDDAAPAAAPSSEPRDAAIDALVEGTEIASTLRVVLPPRDGLLVIDGSAGEGGGQILRTSLALSMLTGKPFALDAIRAGRRKPGLMRQHLTGVKAAAAISGAQVEGASIGSTRLVFRPGAIRGGDHVLDIGSAGATALVLQTIALPLALGPTDSRVVVRGGTHAQWAPPFPFLEHAWLPLVQRMGARMTLALVSSGFYPAGGGEVVMTTEPSTSLSPLHLSPSPTLAPLELAAVVSSLPEGIARRELVAAASLLGETPLRMQSASVRSPGPGNAAWIVARGEGATNVFSAIGEVDVSAEEVGRAMAQSFLAWRASGAAIEEHLADQLMLPIALAGEGSFTCSAWTLHAQTNLEVIAAFTGQRFRVWDLEDGRFRILL